MQITISGRHMHVSDAMRAHVNEKIARLERYNDLLQHIEVVLFEDGDKKVVEATAKAKVGGQYTAKADHEHMKAALDLLMDKLEKQLKKGKQLVKEHRGHKEDRPWQKEQPVEGDEPTYEEVVENM